MPQIGFLLLCGGHSRRMGQPKGLLPVHGVTMAQQIALAGGAFPEKIFSVNEPFPVPEGFVPLQDVYPDCGPMGGLHAALSACKSDALVCAPCDAPYYHAALARFLAAQYDPAWDAVVLQDETGRVHPLMGLYSKSCLSVFTPCLQARQNKLMRALDSLHTKVLPLPPELSQQVFLNLNTPEAYQEWLAQAGEPPQEKIP